MKIHTSLDKIISQGPVAVTIGFFDGVHRGHAALIHHVDEVAKMQGLESLVVTFENHPSTYLNKEHPKTLLYSTEDRLTLLEKLPIDHLLVLSFDAHLARKTAEEFLTEVNHIAPVRYLILGHDAVLGYRRQGDRVYMQKLADDWRFDLEYLDPVFHEGQLVSSSAIRRAIQEGNMQLAEAFLGHSYHMKTNE